MNSGGGGPRVLAIAGGPRRHGNSEQLLDACIDGARRAGADVTKVVVATYGLSPCRGCNACSLTGECVIADRMREIYPLIDSADAVVIGSPVFFATVPGVLKVFYDRMQPYWARRHVLKEEPGPRRPGAYLMARGGGDPFGFDAAEMTTRSVFAVLGIDVVGEVKVEGVDSPSDIGRRPEALSEARDLGLTIADVARPDAPGDVTSKA